MCGIGIALAVAFSTATRALTAGVASQLKVDVVSAYDGVDAVLRFKETGRATIGGARDAIAQRPPIATKFVSEARTVNGVADAQGNLVLPMQIATRANRLLGHPAPERNLAFAWLGDSKLNPLKVASGTAPQRIDQIVVDQATAKADDITVGEPLRLITPVGPLDVNVSGLVSIGSSGGLGGRTIMAFSPDVLAAAGPAGAFYDVLIRFDPGADRTAALAELRAHAAASDPKLEVVTGKTWRAEQAATLAAPLESAALYLTMFTWVTIGVAGILIANTFLVVLQRRATGIALLRLVGTTRRSIIWMLLFEALLVGIVASLPGLGLGLWAAQVASVRLSGLGVALPPTRALLSFGVLGLPLGSGLVVTLLSALGPARRVSGVAPIQALVDQQTGSAALSTRRARSAAIPAILGAASIGWGVSVSNTIAYGVGAALIVVGIALIGPYALSRLSRGAARLLGSRGGAITRLAVTSPQRNPERSFASAAALMIGVGIVMFFALFVSTVRASSSRTTADALLGKALIAGTGVSVANIPDSVPKKLDAASGIDGVGLMRSTVGSDPAGRVNDDDVVIGGATRAFFTLWDTKVPTETAADLFVAAAKNSPIPVLIDPNSVEGNVGDTFRIGHSSGVATVRVVGSIPQNLPGFNPPSVIMDAATLSRIDPSSRVAFVVVDGPGTAEEVAKRAAAALDDEPTAVVQTAAEFQGVGGTELSQLLAVATLLLSMAVIMAVLGITNTVVLSIRERRRELALLRAVGATRGNVVRMILIESQALALIGALGGVVCGLALAIGAVFSVPNGQLGVLQLPVSEAGLVIAGALVAVLASSLIPSIRAGRAPILDGIASP